MVIIIKKYSNLYFQNFYPDFFLIFFLFKVFMRSFSCQFHSFMNHSASSFLNQLRSSFLLNFLPNFVVMGLGHLSSAQAIRVRIPVGTNFFLHFAPTGSSVLWTSTCISGLVQTFASLYGLALAHLGLYSC